MLTIPVHHYLIVVFSLEPKLMEQPLSGPLTVTMFKGKRAITKIPGDDTRHFCHVFIAKASYLATPEFSKAFGS